MIPLEDIKRIGAGLARPECVLCCASGNIYVSNWNGGVTKISADGRQTSIVDLRHGAQLKPNGIALLEDGSFLLANLGKAGGVWRLTPDGVASPWLMSVNGDRLPPCNYVMLDRTGRIWVTVSTRVEPRERAYKPTTNDGFIVLVNAGNAPSSNARIVADGLGYTNEVQLHPSGQWLYVNETFARRLSRFEILEGADLGPRETVAEFPPGAFPDGLAFDQLSRAWVTSIVSNQLFCIGKGKLTVALQDTDSAHTEWVENAFQAGEMRAEHLNTTPATILKNISSLAFGGENLDTLYLGCLLDDAIYTVGSPIRAIEPVHWHWG